MTLALLSVFDRLRRHMAIAIAELNLDLMLACADRVLALECGAVFRQGQATPLLTDLDCRRTILRL